MSVWEQQPDEPNDAFYHFLLYRNLGPGRTLQLAYWSHLATFINRTDEVKKGQKRTEKPEAPGPWHIESSSFKWVDRAYAYDCFVFDKYGERAVMKFVGALDLIAARVCDALADPDFRPKSWRDVVDALGIIQAYAQPETVGSSRQRAEDRPGEPGPGRLLDAVGAVDDGIT